MPNPYLRDAILTASPEQLQLMLYDGAIRFAMQAQDAIRAREIENTHNLLIKAQRIMIELQNGLRPEVAPELCERMGALYSFVYTKFVDANVQKDIGAIDDALSVLRRQRETWQMLVDKVQAAHDDQATDPPALEPAAPAQCGGTLSLEG